MGIKLSPSEFKNRHGLTFTLACRNTPLFPSVKLAQFALETNWGKYTIEDAKNMFGIRAMGQHTPYWNGAYVETMTKEDYGSGQIPVRAKFRKYNTYQDSILDHSHLLLTLPRYAAVRNAKTPEEQCRALQSCGYATGQNYAISLISIINNNNFKEFDKKKV
jgi:flagellar protein FlgJ